MTSFQGRRIEEKYNIGPDSWRHQVRYVPIAQYGVFTVSDTEMPSLRLYQGKGMAQQTYVHLDHFFEIEAKFLQCTKPLYLLNAALRVLLYKFQQFLSGETERAVSENAPTSPLDYGRTPVLKPEQLEMANAGRILEDARHEAAGTCEWTGRELQGPAMKTVPKPCPHCKS